MVGGCSEGSVASDNIREANKTAVSIVSIE